MSRDRDTIREWAEKHDAVPVRETAAGEEPGRFRMVREREMSEDHERMEWEAFFDEMDEGDHVVVYHGQESDEPFQVAGHGDVMADLDDEEIEERLLKGETVTSTVTETAVVESVVVEETTIESELVDSQVTDQRVIDAELVDRECSRCEFVDDREGESRDLFDADRYLEFASDVTAGSDRGGMETSSRQRTTETGTAGTETAGTGTTGAGTETPETDIGASGSEDAGTTTGRELNERTDAGRSERERTATGTGTATDEFGDERPEFEEERDLPYHAELDVEETWSVTRELVERFTVESHIADTEVTEADTIEDHGIDVKGLHRSIAASDILDRDITADEVMTEYDVESELAETDRITTDFTRERTVEEEVVDRKRLRADVTGSHSMGMETISTRDLESHDVEPGDAGMAGTGMSGTDASDVEAGAGGRAGDATGATLTDDEIGKPVVDASGEKIGMVADVDEGGNAMHVDAHPGIADRIRAALGWSEGDRDDYRLRAEKVSDVTDDEVRLKSREHLSEGDRDRDRNR